jgi:hypothetical protein
MIAIDDARDRCGPQRRRRRGLINYRGKASRIDCIVAALALAVCLLSSIPCCSGTSFRGQRGNHRYRLDEDVRLYPQTPEELQTAHRAAVAEDLLRQRQERKAAVAVANTSVLKATSQGGATAAALPGRLSRPTRKSGRSRSSWEITRDALLELHESLFKDVNPAVENFLRENKHTIREAVLWTTPFGVSLVAFTTFPNVARGFHWIVQWISKHSWIPSTAEKVTLQASVVSQVVNGPVITSISILFAALVSWTIKTLHSRQIEIRQSIVLEQQALRRIAYVLSTVLDDKSKYWLQLHELYLRPHRIRLLHETEGLSSTQLQPLSNSVPMSFGSTSMVSDAQHAFIESTLLDFSAECNRMLASEPKGTVLASSFQAIAALIDKILQQRQLRWLSLTEMRFPTVHYLTLLFLATSIGISFLVATDQAGFIFLQGLPVKILWSLLAGSLSATAVLCYDLSHPFYGAYSVP